MENIVDIKHAVLKKVVEYTKEGILEEKLDEIPYEIIPGIKPQYRCCVYREREIIRQRVRMAMGKLPRDVEYTDQDPNQIVHVIPSACEGCPIARFTVTDNCQKCLAKKCVNACNFGAITITSKGAVIDPSKCKECGKCAAACPYNAIVDIQRPCKKSCPVSAINMDENDIATIDPEKCINCGKCVVKCPFGAISDLSMIANVVADIQRGEKVYAMVAPSIEGQFGDNITIGMLKSGLQKLGFKDVFEVAHGADIVAIEEAKDFVEKVENGEKMTSSCCPAFVNLIQKHYPEVADKISHTVSPMVAEAKYIKENIDPNGIFVFIGPCIAKKNEVLQKYIELIPYVITFEELSAMLDAYQIDLTQMEDKGEVASYYGKGFAKSGGVTAAVEKVLKQEGVSLEPKCAKCNGVEECKKALLLLKLGKIPEDFIEGMVCEGGCIAGPVTVGDTMKTKKAFDQLLQRNEKKEIPI